MDADTYSNAGVIEYSNKTFVNVGIFLDKENKVAEKFKVAAIPVTFLVDSEGQKVATWVGYVEAEPYKKGLEQALAAHKKLLELGPKLKASPEDPALLAEAGAIHGDLGDGKKAAEAFAKAAGKTADAKARGELLVKAFKQLNDSEADDEVNKAILDVAERLEKIDPKLGFADDALYARAMADFNKEAWDPAIKKLEEIVAKWPEGDKAPEALLTLGDLYHHVKKDNAKAEKALKAVIEKYPKSELVERAKGFLEHMKKHEEK